MASLSFNFHGHDAFHQEEYKVSRGYFAEGAEEPRTWVFRRMIQNAYLAAKVLQAQPEVDEDRIAAAGMSQGGGMSIWLGALCPIVKVVCADMPFLSAIRHTLSKPVHRYPLKELLDFAEGIPLGKERILHTLSYYDTVNMATFCRVPTQVSMGLKDPSVRPECVQATFDALPGPKTSFDMRSATIGIPQWSPTTGNGCCRTSRRGFQTESRLRFSFSYGMAATSVL